MNIGELAAGCTLKHLNIDTNSQQDLSARPITGCYIGDLLSNVMAHAREGDLWLTVQTHQNVVAVAILLNLAGIVLVEGHRPEEDTIEKARREGMPLLGSELSAFELAGLLHSKGIRVNKA